MRTGLELPDAASLEAFPSPAKSQLTVEAQAGDWIRVTDIHGRVMDRRHLRPRDLGPVKLAYRDGVFDH